MFGGYEYICRYNSFHSILIHLSSEIISLTTWLFLVGPNFEWEFCKMKSLGEIFLGEIFFATEGLIIL